MDETLIEYVADLTGLPKNIIEKKIKTWVLQAGKSPQDLRLEDLREVLVEMIQGLFQEVARGDNEYINLSS